MRVLPGCGCAQWHRCGCPSLWVCIGSNRILFLMSLFLCFWPWHVPFAQHCHFTHIHINMYIYIYINVFIYMQISIQANIFIYLYIHIYIYIYVHPCIHSCTYSLNINLSIIYTCICLFVFFVVSWKIFIYLYIYIYLMYIYICICISWNKKHVGTITGGVELLPSNQLPEIMIEARHNHGLSRCSQRLVLGCFVVSQSSVCGI